MTESASAPSVQVGRDALDKFCENFCGNDSRLVACAESAFYWFNKNIPKDAQ